MIIPGIQVPAFAVMVKPVEGAVGDNKIPRCVQWPIGGAAIHHIQQPSVADDGDVLLSWCLDIQAKASSVRWAKAFRLSPVSKS